MLIAVINNSTLVTNDQVNTMCQAIQIQFNLHVLPAWNIRSCTIQFFPNPKLVPGWAWSIFVIDNDAQVQGALGFHVEDNDKIDGYVMCKPILDNGGTALVFDPKNTQQYTVSGTLSHEAIEMVGDRFTNTFMDNGNISWCMELCDPVEQIGYGIQANGINVSVSDFVFPSFFNPNATLPQNVPFNYLNTLKTPFSILPGGYAIQRTGGPGTETQVFGALMPQWRIAMKKHDLSRFNQRKDIDRKYIETKQGLELVIADKLIK
jgi:hypothetical protein